MKIEITDGDSKTIITQETQPDGSFKVNVKFEPNIDIMTKSLDVSQNNTAAIGLWIVQNLYKIQ